MSSALLMDCPKANAISFSQIETWMLLNRMLCRVRTKLPARKLSREEGSKGVGVRSKRKEISHSTWRRRTQKKVSLDSEDFIRSAAEPPVATEGKKKERRVKIAQRAFETLCIKKKGHGLNRDVSWCNSIYLARRTRGIFVTSGEIN